MLYTVNFVRLVFLLTKESEQIHIKGHFPNGLQLYIWEGWECSSSLHFPFEIKLDYWFPIYFSPDLIKYNYIMSCCHNSVSKAEGGGEKRKTHQQTAQQPNKQHWNKNMGRVNLQNVVLLQTVELLTMSQRDPWSQFHKAVKGSGHYW